MFHKFFTRFKSLAFCLYFFVICELTMVDIISTATTMNGKKLCEELQDPKTSHHQLNCLGRLDDRVYLLTTKCHIYSLPRDNLHISEDKVSLDIDADPIKKLDTSYDCSPDSKTLFYWIKNGNEKPASKAALMALIKEENEFIFKVAYKLKGNIKALEGIKNPDGQRIDFIMNYDIRTRRPSFSNPSISIPSFSGYAKTAETIDRKSFRNVYNLFDDKWDKKLDLHTMNTDPPLLSAAVFEDNAMNEWPIYYIYILKNGNIMYYFLTKDSLSAKPKESQDFLQCNFPDVTSNDESSSPSTNAIADTEESTTKRSAIFGLIIIVASVGLFLLVSIVVYCMCCRGGNAAPKKEGKRAPKAPEKDPKTEKKEKERKKLTKSPKEKDKKKGNAYALIPLTSGSVCSATKVSAFDQKSNTAKEGTKKKSTMTPSTSTDGGITSTQPSKSPSKVFKSPKRSRAIKSKGFKSPKRNRTKSKGSDTSSTPISSPRSKPPTSPASPRSPSH